MFGFFENKVTELYNVIAPEPTDEEKFLSAIAGGDMAAVQGFVEGRGWDANMVNSNGNTPLHVACFNGRIDMLDYFLERGGDAQALGQRGNTALHYAASRGHFDMVKRVVGLGVSPLTRNALGKTAYDVASGLGIKQYLMPLMFNEEHSTGTAPKIAGASVDLAVERERLANLAPPPKMAYADPNLRQSRGPSRQIQPDGFVTTVGNPELAAKYGNTSSYRPASVGERAPVAMAPPTFNAGAKHASPFAGGRYVTYNADTNSAGAGVGMPMAPAAAGAAFQGSGGAATPPTLHEGQAQQGYAAPAPAPAPTSIGFGSPNVNVFNPAPMAAAPMAAAPMAAAPMAAAPMAAAPMTAAPMAAAAAVPSIAPAAAFAAGPEPEAPSPIAGYAAAPPDMPAAPASPDVGLGLGGGASSGLDVSSGLSMGGGLGVSSGLGIPTVDAGTEETLESEEGSFN